MTENSDLYAFYIITHGDETGASAHGPYTMAEAEAKVSPDEKIITRTTFETIKQIDLTDQFIIDGSTNLTQSTLKGNVFTEDLINPGNPFLTIWFKPRGTIRYIIRTDPDKYMFFLAIISGIYQAFDRAASEANGDSMGLWAIILTSILGGAFGGVVSLFIMGFVFGWSGSLLRGKADSVEVRAALAWSSVPDIILLLMFIPIIAIFGHDWFTSSTLWIDANENLFLFVTAILAIVGIPLLIWKAIILIKCLAEVQEFSVWRSLASIVLGFLFIIIPILLLVFGCNALT